jgi:hypothetical protein
VAKVPPSLFGAFGVDPASRRDDGPAEAIDALIASGRPGQVTAIDGRQS